MIAFLARRLAQIVPTLVLVSVIIFLLQQLLPGDPATVMAGEERDPEVIAQIRQQYRLDQPLPVQYVYWIKGVLTGNLVIRRPFPMMLRTLWKEPDRFVHRVLGVLRRTLARLTSSAGVQTTRLVVER